MSDTCDCSGNMQTTSALIDGVYPSGGIDTSGTNWASNFFTINRNGNSIVRIGFNWDSGFELQGVELKLFNCASEGTATHTINVYASASFPSFIHLVYPPGPVGTHLTTGNDINCSGVTTIVIQTAPITAFSIRNYFLEFSFPEGDSNTGIYIAEVRFSDTNITVPTEVSSSPPLPPATTTVEQAASLSSTTSHFSTPPLSTASSSLSVTTSTAVTLLHSLQLSSSSFYTFRTTSK